jgi:hypothetical protein
MLGGQKTKKVAFKDGHYVLIVLCRAQVSATDNQINHLDSDLRSRPNQSSSCFHKNATILPRYVSIL